MKIVRVSSLAVFACALFAVTACTHSASPARTTRASGHRLVLGSTRRYWLVLGSTRDGYALAGDDPETRAYSMRPNGSRLTRVLRPSRALEPLGISGDGRTVAYTDNRYPNAIYVSRSDGAGLRRVARGTKRFNIDSAVLSPDGKRLAFTIATGNTPTSQIFIVGTDGRGRRHLASGSEPDWSPDGKALVFGSNAKCTVVVQPLHGRRRVLARGACSSPRWSPNGRWIAYESSLSDSTVTLWAVRPSGKGRHRVVHIEAEESPYSWSPDSRRLAFTDFSGVSVVGINGGPRRLRLGITPSTSVLSPKLAWSPDGSRLMLAAHAGDDPDQIWVVGSDGRGLRRLTSAGANIPLGWTRLPPVLPPAAPIPPSERVLGPKTVATRKPVAALSADGPRVAFVPSTSVTDCEHVAVWIPAKNSILRVSQRLPAPCSYTGTLDYAVYELALAGSRVAWADIAGCGNSCDVAFTTATLPQARPVSLSQDTGGGGADGGELIAFNPRGHGDLLVFNSGDWLIRITEQCPRRCTTLRTGAHKHTYPVESVSGHLIAVREPAAVAVLDDQGSLVKVLPFGKNQVKAARLDGGRLVVARSTALEVYDATTGAPVLQRPLPAGYALTDVDGGIAVLLHGKNILLLRLADGRSLMFTPARGPVLADLEPAGLYYSYVTATGGGRLVFVLRSELERRLGSNAR